MAEATATSATPPAAATAEANSNATTTITPRTNHAEQKPENSSSFEEQPVPPEENDNNDNDATSTEKDPKDIETATDATGESMVVPTTTMNNKKEPIVSNSKKSRPPYKYDPDKITLRFLFANRDGLTVTLECTPNDTVGEVKAALLSVWPDGKFYTKTRRMILSKLSSHCRIMCLLLPLLACLLAL